MDFLRYSGQDMKTDAAVLYAHPCALRTFLDIHVPKLLEAEQNIKKISYSCAGQLREHFLQSASKQLGKIIFVT